MVNRDALKKRRAVSRDGSGQDADFDEYLEQEARDNQWRDEWAAHGQPNAQGLYDIGWYADGIKPAATANTANIGGRNGRPQGHMKHYTSGTMATNGGYALPVQRGERVPEASRGVGQESIDGFINNNPMAQWRDMDEATRQKVLAAYIRSQLLQKQN